LNVLTFDDSIVTWAKQGGIDEAEAEAWIDDLHERAEAGEYFFNLNQ
jgi:hypothetical protein